MTSNDSHGRDAVVGAIEYGISHLSTFGSVVALVATAALVTWVIGLLIVLRGSRPDQRSEIIYAYAHCNPLCTSDRTPRLEARAQHLRAGETVQQTMAAGQITRDRREIVARS
jgi:hypothetical protein